MLFDPVKFKENGQEFMLRRLLGFEFDTSKPMGNCMINELGTIIHFILVGAYPQVAPVVPRFVEWLQIAIDNNEDFDRSRNFHYQRLYWAKAIYLWLFDNEPSQATWEGARKFSEAVMLEEKELDNPQNRVLSFDDYMAFCVGAKQYELGILEYEKFDGAQSISIKKNLKPREFGYAVCLHHAKGIFTKAEMIAAGEKMLRSNLQETWLGRGQFIRAATWLKVIYWDAEVVKDPKDTILKAYDHMPKVSRPSFL